MPRAARGRAHIDELAQKYLGEPYDESWIKTERVIFEIEPQRSFACDVTNDGTAAEGVWRSQRFWEGLFGWGERHR